MNKLHFWFCHVVAQCEHVMRKLVFEVFNQLRLKPACSADGTTAEGLEMSAIASRDIILSRQRTTKALIRLCG